MWERMCEREGYSTESESVIKYFMHHSEAIDIYGHIYGLEYVIPPCELITESHY